MLNCNVSAHAITVLKDNETAMLDLRDQGWVRPITLSLYSIVQCFYCVTCLVAPQKEKLTGEFLCMMLKVSAGSGRRVRLWFSQCDGGAAAGALTWKPVTLECGKLVM